MGVIGGGYWGWGQLPGRAERRRQEGKKADSILALLFPGLNELQGIRKDRYQTGMDFVLLETTSC